MEALDKLKQKRTNERSSITKLITKIESLLSENIETTNIEELQEMNETILERENTLKMLNSQIETQLKDAKEFEKDISESIIQVIETHEISNAELDYPPENIRELLKDRGIILVDVDHESLDNNNVSLLIGADNYWKLVKDKIERLNSTLVTMETQMGWILMGKLSDHIDDKENVTNAVAMTSLLIHTSKIENLWKLDLLGIRDPVETKCRKEMEIAALNHFNGTVTFKEGRYEIQLPWVTEKDCLRQNFDIARQRLNSATHRLIQKSKFEDYENVLTDWLNEGIIEVLEHEMNNQCHYLPHKGIFKETSTMKLRPVFDASCKDKNSRSLNDCLEKGPNLLKKIIPIILRFRKNRIGVVSDIRKAFLQMSVNKSDRDFLRFLWWKDFDKDEFRVFRYKRVVFGLNCSLFLLAAVLSHHIDLNSSKYSETAENLKKSFYVDNCTTSVPDEDTLTRFIEESKQILDSASFDLRGWEHTSLLKSEDSIEPTPVLGILWDKKDDSRLCEVKTATDKPVNLTRRNILSAVHRIFDSMGFLCPITPTPKLLIQKTWLLKIGWDTNIPEDLGKEFYSWIDDLSFFIQY
ncbi:uncharacterized protein LOC118189037 [Stegodyphus dumicola]|uniref:uncharacterized protein LOC118189037 n=1 Tax=Stegodyphus dumicola TaxID=202533 RepID=UPI0015AF7FB7|nr:uncharacterized protein LOC118189037 [Stegodyphus dumicola]